MNIKTLTFIILLLTATQSFAAASFLNLHDGQTFRSTSGAISVLIKADEEYVLLIDGEPIRYKKGPNTKITGYLIRGLDNGRHTLKIVTDSGTEKITIRILRIQTRQDQL